MEKCSKIEEMIINGNLETDLAVESNEAVDKHTAECSECRTFVEDLKKISSEIKNIDKIKVSDGFSHALKIKLDAAKHENRIAEPSSVPFFTRMVYYASGVAAMLIAFMYVSSLGVFDSKIENNILPSAPASVQFASTEKETKPAVTDSLENLRNNVANDEELRLKVNAGE